MSRVYSSWISPSLVINVGHIVISTHGLLIYSVDGEKIQAGSPNSLVAEKSRSYTERGVEGVIMAEMFARPRCGLELNQFPVLLLIISSSSGEKIAIVADRRMPPLITASAKCIVMSNAMIGVMLSMLDRRSIILVCARFNGNFPGAFPPCLKGAPSSLIDE